MSGSKYPQQIDGNSELVLTTDNVTAVKAQVVNDLRSAIIAIESELGLDPSGIYGTVRARLDAMTALLSSLTGSGSGGSGNIGLTTQAPVNVTKSAAQLGSIQKAALSDHKHDISTSTATTIGSTNSEGSSTFLSRSDHTHAVADLAINAQVKGSVLYYNGTNWVQLSPSTDGFVLTTHGSGNNPTWQTSPTGTSLTNTNPVNVTKAAAAVGVAIDAARADHKHDISTAAPNSIGNANTEGTATSIARSDHIHALAGTVGGDLSGTLPNPTVAKLTMTGQVQGSVLYYNGTSWVVLNPGTDGYVLTTHSVGNNPAWTSLPNGIALAVVAPSDVDKSAALVGVSARAAHEDHKHNISTATAINVGAANAEGTATSLARSDHTHAVIDFKLTSQAQGDVVYFNGTNWVRLPASTDGFVLTTHSVGANPTWTTLPAGLGLATIAPVNVTKSIAVLGASPRAAKEDHKHDISTASAVSIGAANTEGSATTLARSDHTHAITDFSITGQTQGDIVYFNGTNWVRLAPSTDGFILTTHSVGANPTWSAAPAGVTLANTAPVNVDVSAAAVGVGTTAARSDHKHNVSVGIPVSIDVTNAQGSATTLARSDHTHKVTGFELTSQAQGSITYFNGSNWVVLTAGTSGFALTTQGVGANPIWAATLTLSAVAPVNVNVLAAAVGVATTAARSDHKHNIDVGVPVSIGAANAQGSATTLARSDHTHAVTDLSISGQVRGDIVFYNGSNWVRLPAGQDGYVLTTHGIIANPTWTIVGSGSGGGVTSVFTRTGAIVATSGDYTSTLITNSSTVTGASVTNALNTLNSAIAGLVTGVSSVFGRTGAVIAVANDYNASKIANDSGVSGTFVKDALDTLNARVTGVSSVFGRTGAVVAATNDYTSTQIQNLSGVAGTGVTGALNTLNSAIAGLVTGVSSVFGRTGAVVAATNDYTSTQISNSSGVAGTGVTGALNTLNSAIAALNSSQIIDVSNIGGSTVTGALNLLQREYVTNTNTKSFSFTVLNTDINSLILITSGSGITCTIPPQSTGNFVTGSRYSFMLYTAGSTLSFVAGSGAVNIRLSGAIAFKQYAILQLEQVGLNDWVVWSKASTNQSFDINDASSWGGASIYDSLNSIYNSSFKGNIGIPLNPLPVASGVSYVWGNSSGTITGPGGGWVSKNSGSYFLCQIGPFPANLTIDRVDVWISPVSGHGGLPTVMPTLKVYRVLYNANAVAPGTLIASVVDTSASVPAYEAQHVISTGTFTPVSTANTSFYFYFSAESGSNVVLGSLLSYATVHIP